MPNSWPVPTCKCGCGRCEANGDRYAAKGLADTCYRRIKRSQERRPLHPSPLTTAIRCVGISTVARRLGVTCYTIRQWITWRRMPSNYALQVSKLTKRRCS
jgi:hypothetical protein